MKTNHTPGPWFLTDRDERGHRLILAPCDNPEDHPVEGAVIAEVWDCTTDHDAVLLDAAPDLLAALTGLVAFVREHINDDCWDADEDVPEMKPALAALAKATQP